MKIPFFRDNGGPPGGQRPTNLLAVGTGDSLFSEKFRALRAMVEQKADLHGWKVLGVTSSVTGEGKTLSCAQLGMGLAATGRKRVLLVDVDIRKADLTHGMGAHRTPGLTEYLLGKATLPDILHDTSIPNLFLVTSGADVHSPADLLAGETFQSFLKEARKLYDTVLLDTPPILPVADTPTIREMTDGFLVLYRTGFTPHALFRQALDELGEKYVIGAVLNGVEGRSDSYYQKYYGSYYKGKSRSFVPESTPSAGPEKE